MRMLSFSPNGKNKMILVGRVEKLYQLPFPSFKFYHTKPKNKILALFILNLFHPTNG